MAYAAMLSLEKTITGIFRYSSTEILMSEYHHVCSLRRTLKKCSEGVGDIYPYMDEQMMIIEAAIKLEDAIEFSLLSHQPPTFSSNLDDNIHCFVQTAKETEQTIKGSWEQKRSAKEIKEDHIEEEEEEEAEEEDVEMVGLCDQFLQIRDKVLEAYEVESSCLLERVIWISGMAGVGKTALAKKVFHDPLIKANFQSRDQLNLDNRGMTQNFLLFLDDVWDPNLIWGLFRETRLGKEKGIVILLTSRTDLTISSYFSVKMRFMNEEESWELLRRKVFGEEEEYCPPQLVKPGKKIAEKCEGLPLLINAVAPILLSKAQKDPERWNRVALKPDSILEEASHQISQVLLKSYNQITEDEKLCFLYIASFPLSCVVPHSTITNLWLAEGFKFYSWTYNGLIGKNLVIDNQKSWSEAEAFTLHCSYWYVSKRVAMNNKFLYVIKSCADDLDESIKSHRRLAIQENVMLAIKEVYNKIASITNVRSLLCTGPYNQYQVPICWEWKLLRILHILTIRFYEFPIEVVKLIRLKYLALTCNANLPPSISKLWNLEFLIVHQHLNVKRVGALSYLPVELAPDATQTSSCFDHISSLFALESFESVVMNSTLSIPPPPLLNFGSNLRRLSLSGFGYPWKDMSKIAEIEFLEELRLECYAFRGEKWEAKEMRFLNLRRLLIEDTDLVQWTAEDENFPGLSKLTMKNWYKLREIPIRGRRTYVEVVDCNPLVETWAKQCYKCDVKYSWKGKVKS